GKVPLVGDLLNKPAKWYYDEGVAMKITASSLRNYVKDMYDGYLTVMGDPSAKPHDMMILNDFYSKMSGPSDIKEVTHIMNHESGFITMIKPDVICFNTDPSTMRFATKAATVAAYALSSFYIRSLLAAKGYK